MKIKGITANIFFLGLVSFLTDVSSDMLYPLLPIFLTQTLGASQLFVGLVEGIAESTAALFTLFSGIAADKSKDRSRLILFGYSLSSFSRPLAALATSPWMVLWVRFTDRVGKGLRTAPRDALIADSADKEHHAKAYGFHRSMDHLGAVFGPLLAGALLAWCFNDLRQLFWIASIPGILAVIVILWRVREVNVERALSPQGSEPWFRYFPKGKLRSYLLIHLIFVASCSSDAFLMMRASELGVPMAMLPIIWLTMSLVMTFLTTFFGALSDRYGRRRMIVLGWFVYALVYLGFSWAHLPWHAWALFIAYGLYYSITEGAERALLAQYAEPGKKAQAFGWYYFIVGLGALPASLLFGFVWQKFGSQTAFLMSSIISFIAFLVMGMFVVFSRDFSNEKTFVR